MKKERLFILNTDYSNKNVVVNSIDKIKYGIALDKAMSDMHNLAIGNYSGIKFPVPFYATSGSVFSDIIRTGSMSLVLISKRVKNLLEENNCKGFTTFEVVLNGSNKIKVNEYYGFSITGKCSYPDWNKSEIINKKLTSSGPLVQHYKGFYVNLNSLTDLDFYSVESTFFRLISKKVHDIFVENQVTNCKMTGLLDFEIAVSSIPNN